MYIVQKHDENDNGNDQIWIWRSEEKAIAQFNELCDHYKRICADEGDRAEWWGSGDRHCLSCEFRNADETLTTFSLNEIDPMD